MDNSPEILLTKFAFAYQNAAGEQQIRGIGDELSAAEIERARKFCSSTAFLQSFVSNFISLRTDFDAILDIENGLASVRLQTKSILHSEMVETMFAQAEAQRRLSNFLSSAAAFRDRALKAYSRKYSKSSEQYNMLKSSISEEYDAELYYRLMYNLRNFAMHEDAPIGLMPISIDMTDEGGPILSAKVMLKKVDFEKSLDVQSRVRNELKLIPTDTFDVRELSISYYKSHRRILSKMIELHLPDLKSEYLYYDGVFREEAIEGAALVVMEARKRSNGLSMQLLHLPMEMIDFFEYIEKTDG